MGEGEEKSILHFCFVNVGSPQLLKILEGMELLQVNIWYHGLGDLKVAAEIVGQAVTCSNPVGGKVWVGQAVTCSNPIGGKVWQDHGCTPKQLKREMNCWMRSLKAKFSFAWRMACQRSGGVPAVASGNLSLNVSEGIIWWRLVGNSYSKV